VRIADMKDAGCIIKARLHARERRETGEDGEALFGDVLRVFRIEAGRANLDGVFAIMREIAAGLELHRAHRLRREAFDRVAID
jgi:hypothetical protein